MRVPVVLLVDDPAPLVNLYWWHASYRGEARHPDGRPVRRDVPLDFLDRFCDVVASYGVMGKFSVVPYPAGLGPITEGWSGRDAREIEEWLNRVRRRIYPRMDISPEMLTHHNALDLSTAKPLDERENDWSSHQNVQTLREYIVYALSLLKAVGLRATGVTSPWDFGIHVEDAYREAILKAFAEIRPGRTFWYFLHIRPDGRGFGSSLVLRRRGTALVSICSVARDYLWQAMETDRSDDEYVSSTADCLLTEDGNGGRLAELFHNGAPIVFHTHWQSLFCDGRETGLEVLERVCQRMEDNWRGQYRWMSCSQFAERIAASARNTKQRSSSQGSGP